MKGGKQLKFTTYLPKFEWTVDIKNVRVPTVSDMKALIPVVWDVDHIPAFGFGMTYASSQLIYAFPKESVIYNERIFK